MKDRLTNDRKNMSDDFYCISFFVLVIDAKKTVDDGNQFSKSALIQFEERSRLKTKFNWRAILQSISTHSWFSILSRWVSRSVIRSFCLLPVPHSNKDPVLGRIVSQRWHSDNRLGIVLQIMPELIIRLWCLLFLAIMEFYSDRWDWKMSRPWAAKIDLTVINPFSSECVRELRYLDLKDNFDLSGTILDQIQNRSWHVWSLFEIFEKGFVVNSFVSLLFFFYSNAIAWLFFLDHSIQDIGLRSRNLIPMKSDQSLI